MLILMLLKFRRFKTLLKPQRFGQNGNACTSASKNTAKGERMRDSLYRRKYKKKRR
jgi:hypothetical protein